MKLTVRQLDCPLQASIELWQLTGSKNINLCVILYTKKTTIVEKTNDLSSFLRVFRGVNLSF